MEGLRGPEALIFLVLAIGLTSIGVTIARAIAKRIAGGSAGAREIEALHDEVSQLRADLEGMQARLSDVDEIQSRLDFTERVLAQARERGLLGAPKDGDRG